MEPRQKLATEQLHSKLCEEMDIDEIISYLQAHVAITAGHVARIRSLTTQREQRILLLEILKFRDDGWNNLCQALVACKQAYLQILLESACYNGTSKENNFSGTSLIIDKNFRPLNTWMDRPLLIIIILLINHEFNY